jgi:hypothetical protein
MKKSEDTYFSNKDEEQLLLKMVSEIKSVNVGWR